MKRYSFFLFASLLLKLSLRLCSFFLVFQFPYINFLQRVACNTSVQPLHIVQTIPNAGTRKQSLFPYDGRI
jgi:hypothetical protein